MSPYLQTPHRFFLNISLFSGNPSPIENPSFGLALCKQDNKSFVECYDVEFHVYFDALSIYGMACSAVSEYSSFSFSRISA